MNQKLKISGIILGSVLIVAGVIGYQKYQEISSKVLQLTPELRAELKALTDAQIEPAQISQSAPRIPTEFSETRNVYFGDLHTHTALSFDAYIFGNRISLDEAYDFANGKPQTLASGEVVKLSRPLDFVAMTDHAESFGLFESCASENLTKSQKDFCNQFDTPSVLFFAKLRKLGEQRPPVAAMPDCDEPNSCEDLSDQTWATIVAAADEHNNPGVFTAFAAYEYSPPLPESGKIHRNVIFANSHVPEKALSVFTALTTLDLWQGLEETCKAPCEVLTIPHNMNKMWGLAYSGHTIDGDAYSASDWALRGRSEPLAEVFQIKGSSECAIGAGSVDEECGFEQFLPICEEGETIGCITKTSMAREGLKIGLSLQQELGFNPLRFGLIGATDTHNSNPGDTEEWDYRGASGIYSSPANKRIKSPTADYKSQITKTPGGLTAVWAKENTRASLFEAMLNRETYATSGTRIKLRFFASPEGAAPLDGSQEALMSAYDNGLAMGGNMPKRQTSPTFQVQAQADSFSAAIERVQIVKGWIENGETFESVTDIACGDGSAPDPSGKCPHLAEPPDLTTCAVDRSFGVEEVSAIWSDPEFKTDLPAFYYVRVLEAPTCRWSTFDALRLNEPLREDVPATIRERAWSSPIWYLSK